MSSVDEFRGLVAENRKVGVGRGDSLQVLCAGLSRTGTLSLYTAFQKLGYRSYHMAELIENSTAAKRWKQVMEQELATGNVDGVDFREFFDGYTAACDAPACDYFFEIAKAYPDCKILLTTRDADAWWHSISTVLFEPHHLNTLHRMASWWIPGLRPVLSLTDSWHKLYAKRYGAMDKHVMQKRIDEVQAKIPKERLLVWKVQDGWPPLCEFLGRPVPDEPFPRMNDSAKLISTFHKITFFGMTMWAVTGAVTVAAGAWLLRRYR